jgi:spore maturation protein CgeB
MKILIPNFFTPDSFEENVTVTLREMGHQVLNMGSMSIEKKSSPIFRLWKEVQSKILRNISLQEKWLLHQITEYKPDVVMCLTQALTEEVLHEVRKKGCRVVAWWGDTAANMHGKGLCHKNIDLIFIKDHYAAFKLKTLGLPAFQLYEAMNPLWHRPMIDQQNTSITIAGSFYDYRHFLTEQLLEKKVEVELYGARLPYWASEEIKKKHTGRFIVKEEKSKVFGQSLAVLNSTAMSEFASVNCRAFEVAGTGALQIMEYRPSIEECFEPDKEILLYKTFDELIALIDRAKADQQRTKSIRAAAAKRALNDHTYRHRLNHILQMVEEL